VVRARRRVVRRLPAGDVKIVGLVFNGAEFYEKRREGICG